MQQPVPNPKKPMWSFALSLVSGILVLLEGLVRIIRGEAISFLASDEVRRRFFGFLTRVDGVIGLILGIIIIVGAILIYNSSSTVAAGSIVVLVFSLASIISGGGWLIGLILGLIGGILGLLKK